MIRYFSVALLFVSLRAGVDAVDLTVTDKATGSEVVDAVYDLIDQSCVFTDDRLMLRRIASVETDDGINLRTFVRGGVDFYGGIWQIDEDSFKVTQVSADVTVYAGIKASFGIEWTTLKYIELLKPLYSGLAARLLIDSYYRASKIPQDVMSQAAYWAQNYTTNDWGTVANAIELYEEASNRTATKCSSPKADVVFVLDSSGSITAPNFNNVRQFVIDVVQSFVIGSDNVRVALIQFSDTAILEFGFSKYNTVDQLVDAISGIPYLSKSTNTAAGLELLSSVVNSTARYAEGVPVIAVVMTDGQSDNPTATAAEAARMHKDLGDKMTVQSIGVGNGAVISELDVIASDPDCQNVFLLDSFRDVTAFSYQMMKTTCTAPAQVTEGKTVSGVLLAGENYYFKVVQVKVKKNGIQIHLVTAKGSSVSAHFSWKIQNPSSAVNDFSINVNDANNNGQDLFIPWSQDGNSNRQRRDVSGNSANSTATIYGSISGVGAQSGGNKFELSYVQSTGAENNSPPMSTAGIVHTFLLALLAVLILRH